MPELWWLNGSFARRDDARVSIMDRGMLFGDGLYEVVRVYDNQPFCLDEHLDRFFFGVQGVEMPFPLTRGEFRKLIHDVVRESNLGGASLYWEVTRGAYNLRTHYFTSEMTSPTVFMQTKATAPPAEELRRNGIKVLLLPDIRWLKCCYKTVNLMGNCLAMTKAHNAGLPEAVLYRDEGHVTECTASSFFIVRDGSIWTHPKGDLILPGITRGEVKKLCAREGIPFEERVFGLKDVVEADEAFLTGSLVEVVPIVATDIGAIGSGKPGPVTKKVVDLFRRHTGQS